MENLLKGGIFATLLIAFWQKVKEFLWYFMSFFICKVQFYGDTCRHGSKYVWDYLENTKSIAPIYSMDIRGSGKNNKVYLREIGFRNFRFVKVGKVPCLAKINESLETTIYTLKPFMNHEKLYLKVFEYYQEKYLNFKETEEKRYSSSSFFTEFCRGTLNSNNSNLSNKVQTQDEAIEDVPAGNSPFIFAEAEKLDIGRRINFTKGEYKQAINFTKEKSTLLDSLNLTPNMNSIKNKLEKWFNHKEWFLERDIQWKRGFLLHGSPGTGKTTLVTALAEYFNVPVFIFDLATFTNEDLHRKWNYIKSHTPCFVVFEDFDSVFDGRTNIYSKNAMTDNPLSFDCVLNILDGAVKFDGVVTFVTTNNIDKIDSAMGGQNSTRPGRVDYTIEIDGLTEETKHFLTDKMFKDMENYERLKQKALQFDCKTPAQFKEVCINIALESYDD